MDIKSYRELEVWQGDGSSLGCYEITKTFPKSETYGLSSQVQRAAVSIPANIAEGRGRLAYEEFINISQSLTAHWQN
jgi:four helix bundle protein